MKTLDDYSSYRNYFSESRLWDKIGKAAHKAGIKVVYAALLLFYVATDKNVPVEDKAKIFGALGYFILPFDLIPDAIPVAGYTDDLAALFWALHAVWSNVTPDIEAKAKRKLKEWFGQVDENELNLF